MANSQALRQEAQVGNSKIFFGHLVTRQRAEYLAKCLGEPLCSDCGRELAECDADPCAMKQHQHDAMVVYPLRPERYASEKGQQCPACGGENFEGGSIEIGAGTATQKVWCTTGDCHALWYDEYTLTSYTMLREDDQ